MGYEEIKIVQSEDVLKQYINVWDAAKAIFRIIQHSTYILENNDLRVHLKKLGKEY